MINDFKEHTSSGLTEAKDANEYHFLSKRRKDEFERSLAEENLRKQIELHKTLPPDKAQWAYTNLRREQYGLAPIPWEESQWNDERKTGEK